MNQPIVPVQEVISPAEAKFWQEQAEKAPAFLRPKLNEAEDRVQDFVRPITWGAFGLGAVLTGLTFTKYIPGKWKIASGAAAGASLGLGYMSSNALSAIDNSGRGPKAFLSALEQSPALKERLARYLSVTVTAQDIQTMGLDQAVGVRTLDFGATTPYLNLDIPTALPGR